MKRRHVDELAVRREALIARAQLQRIELSAAFADMRGRSMASSGARAVALALVRRVISSWSGRGAGLPMTGAQPWMLTAGVLLVRALRASPTARWVTGAVALGAAAWWVARAVRTPGAAEDESG